MTKGDTTVSKILTRGNPQLEQPSPPVQWPDPEFAGELASLQRELADFRREHGYGRAIAAPQIGIQKRFIAFNLGATPFTLVNPEITWRSDDMFELWDDCLSVPDHVVRVRRNCSVSLRYLDELGRERHWQRLPAHLAELVQHEIDHLGGALMTERTIDTASIRPILERDELVGAARPTHRLSLDAIAEAAKTIDPVFLNTPQYECEPLSQALGCRLLLKLETTNPIRSFKGRGADYFVSRIVARGDSRPLVCASAGNFGQALGYACRKHELDLVVFASEHANPLKVERMRSLGADVRLTGEDFDAAKAAAKAHAQTTGAWMVEDGREPEISEGAGAIGVELLARDDALDAVLVPLGNGAMLNGIARWLKAASPATAVFGVSSSGANAMERSWRSGQVVELNRVDTIADGIAVRVPIPEAVEDMYGQVDDVLLVDDPSIVDAMRLLYTHAGLVTEPAGAAGVAAALAMSERFAGQRLATIVCGSNVSDQDAKAWSNATFA
jgi:threonine dehydratase/peptide deformylase